MNNTLTGNQLLLGYARDQDIRPLFELLGMVAKADGRVSNEAIREVEKFITMQLAESQRDFAIACFRSGKELPLTKGVATKRAFQLYGFQIESDVERWLEPLQILDILLRVAMADGTFSDEKSYIIDSVRSTFAFSVRHYWTMRSTIAELFNIDNSTLFSFKADKSEDSSSTSSQYRSQNKSSNHSAKVTSRITSKKEALKLLKLGEVATLQDIKIAYRKLVKLYHPDMLKSSQATEQEVENSILTFCQIQAAYEYLIEALVA